MSLSDSYTARNEGISLDLDTVRNGVVAAFILCIPLAIVYLVPIEVHSPHIERVLLKATVIGPLDVISLVIVVVALPLLIKRSTYSNHPIGLIGAVAFTIVTAAFLVANPSAEGIARLVRFAGITGVIATIRWMTPSTFRHTVVWPLTISLLIQAPWALLQTYVWRNGHESGITARFDHAWTHGYGTMDGGYALAAFVVLAIAIILSSGAYRKLHPLMWVSIVLGSASISTSFGRQGVLAALAIGGLYGLAAVIKRNAEYLAASFATVLPMSVGIAATWIGWSVRASETAAGFQSGRESLLDRAFAVIGSNPLFGVGPARYGPYLARIGITETDITIVHNVPVLISAEYGVPVGILFAVWVGLLGIAALFTSFRAVAIFFAVLPYLIFDHPHIAYAYGIAEFGVWLAALDFHRRHRNYDSQRTAAEQATTDVPAIQAA
jgi:hypothetical protein